MYKNRTPFSFNGRLKYRLRQILPILIFLFVAQGLNGQSADGDTDGDGVQDAVDIDDDNDGILDIEECETPPVRVGNFDGTFETFDNVASDNLFNSDIDDGGWRAIIGTPDTWVSPMPTTGTGVWGGLNDGTPSSPDGGVMAGCYSNDLESFATTIGGLTIGDSYTVIFYQANGGCEGSTNLGSNARWRVSFGGANVWSPNIPYLGESNQIWSSVSLEYTATATSHDLTFQGRPSASSTARVRYASIDGIVVMTTSTDTDDDSVFDCFDLDSDNDGISDFVESGFANPEFDLNNDGTISIAEAEAQLGAGNADIDGDGLLDIFDADTGSTDAALSAGTDPDDFDNDNIPNYLDLDSDADGIPDTVEAFQTANFLTNFATDGDLTDDEADRDGAVSIFDDNDITPGRFEGSFMNPENTDGTDNPDYLDTDSDNDGISDTDESGLTLSGTDANNDGIDDDASIGASYADPNGEINDPSSTLDNELGDTSEVAYRELLFTQIHYMRHGKHFTNGSEQNMKFGKNGI